MSERICKHCGVAENLHTEKEIDGRLMCTEPLCAYFTPVEFTPPKPLEPTCDCKGEMHDEDCPCTCTDYRSDPHCRKHSKPLESPQEKDCACEGAIKHFNVHSSESCRAEPRAAPQNLHPETATLLDKLGLQVKPAPQAEQRYSPYLIPDGDGYIAEMCWDPNGQYVKLSYQAPLLQKIAELEAEVKVLRGALIYIGRKVGCLLSDEVSTGFIATGVPDEVTAKIAELEEKLREVGK